MNFQEWFNEGIEDYERTKRLVNMNDVKAAYFFLHQCIEKILKALLLKKGIFIKTHNISILYDQALRQYPELSRMSSDEVMLIKNLTIHYAASRYPNARIRAKLPEDIYSDKAEILKVLQVIERFINLCKEILHKDSEFGADEFGRSIDDLLTSYVEKIKKFIKNFCLIIYGSRVRNDWKPWSDIDIVIISDELKDRNFDELFKIFHEPLIDYKLYTIDEAIEAIKKGELTILLALHEGKIIHDDSTCTKLKELFNKFWRVETIESGFMYKFLRICCEEK